jgi:hypothetical protein
MLRVLLILLGIVTDYQTITSISHLVFVLGLASASVLGCVGVRLAIGHWLANRDQADSDVRCGG